MKRFFLSLLFSACILPVCLQAQNNQADEFIKAGKYNEAVEVLESARTRGTAVTQDLINLAYCYIVMHEYQKAEGVYETIVQDKKCEARQWFMYGEVLRTNGKYEKAKEAYQHFVVANPEDFEVKQRLLSCDSLSLWQKTHSKNIVDNESVVNTVDDEMNPLPGNGFRFISNHKKYLAEAAVTTRFSDSQLSFIYEKAGGSIKALRFFSDSVTYTGLSVAACGKMAVVIKTIRSTPDGEVMGHSVIMTGTPQAGFREFRPEGFPAGYIASHPSLSSDGRRLYFSGNIPGGQGGVDLYYSDLNGNAWTAPVNLGSEVNTPGNEMFPWISGDGKKLYFASDGHAGYGNLDIFVAEVLPGKFGTAVNLKAPVNSIGNDFGFILSDNPYTGYFVSNRYESSKGGNDIYAVHFPEPVVVPDTVVPPVVQVVPGDTSLVYFKTSSSTIEPLFYAGLDAVAATLKKFPYLKVNVETRADARGTEALNANLCQQRAAAISEYLVKQGIEAQRIISKPSGIALTPGTEQIRYHVQIGYMPGDQAGDYYKRRIRNEAAVACLPYAKGYGYFAGSGSLQEARQLRKVIKARYGIDGLLTASYQGYYLSELKYAPCRRAVLSFSK